MIKINWTVHSPQKQKPENLFQNRICGLDFKIRGITLTTIKKRQLILFLILTFKKNVKIRCKKLFVI